MRKLLLAFLLILLFSVQAFAEQDYQFWKWDVENRDSDHSVTHVALGDGYTITATNTSTSTTLATIWKMSLWDGYRHVRDQVLDIGSHHALIVNLTTTEQGLLGTIQDGTLMWNKTLLRLEICHTNGTIWAAAN